jgi:hypothetical protein
LEGCPKERQPVGHDGGCANSSPRADPIKLVAVDHWKVILAVDLRSFNGGDAKFIDHRLVPLAQVVKNYAALFESLLAGVDVFIKSIASTLDLLDCALDIVDPSLSTTATTRSRTRAW